MRDRFSNRLGFILISAGCAIGIGNVWRFPYIVGQYGGAAFVLIYLFFLVILGLPVMVMEYSVGRASQKSAALSFDVLEPKGTKWHFMKYVAMAGNYILMMFYTSVCGWLFYYFYKMLIGDFNGLNVGQINNEFGLMLSNPLIQVGMMFLVVCIGFFICSKGLQNGVEKVSKYMMLSLLALMLVLAVRSLILPGAMEGVKFYLLPDFSKMQNVSDVVFAAMGQAFFSMSLGMGCLSTYASYFGKETRLGHTAMSVGLIDTCVAVLAGLIIFPAAFSVGIQPDAGPSLIFITLPNVFQQAFANVPFLAYICSVAFYVLLALAALTSTISLHEVSTAFLHEKFHFTRGRAACIVTGGCLLIGVVSSLALGEWSSVKIGGLNMFDALDYLTAKIMLPVCGMFAAVFVGWVLDKSIVKGEVTNYGMLKAPYYPVYLIVLKFVAPIGILAIFINELGLLSW